LVLKLYNRGKTLFAVAFVYAKTDSTFHSALSSHKV